MSGVSPWHAWSGVVLLWKEPEKQTLSLEEQQKLFQKSPNSPKEEAALTLGEEMRLVLAQADGEGAVQGVGVWGVEEHGLARALGGQHSSAHPGKPGTSQVAKGQRDSPSPSQRAAGSGRSHPGPPWAALLQPGRSGWAAGPACWPAHGSLLARGHSAGLIPLPPLTRVCPGFVPQGVARPSLAHLARSCPANTPRPAPACHPRRSCPCHT